MKHIISISLVLALSASSLVALEGVLLNDDAKVSKALQKSEKELLFGESAQNVDVEILTEKEMQETKGEFLASVGAGLVILAVDKIGQKKGWWK